MSIISARLALATLLIVLVAICVGLAAWRMRKAGKA